MNVTILRDVPRTRLIRSMLRQVVRAPTRVRIFAVAPAVPLAIAAAFTLISLSTGLLTPHRVVGVSTPYAAAAGLTMAFAYACFWFLAGRHLESALATVLTVVLTATTVVLSPGVAGIEVLWAFPALLLGYAVRPTEMGWALGGLSVLGVALALVGVPGPRPRYGGALLVVVVVIALAGLLSSTVAALVRRNAELEAAREELAAIAVEEERTRFGRDLHDLLGHTLSLVLVKTRLAGRLLPGEPEAAAAELRDVEGLARRALEEVREVAGGYRQPTLASELAGAEAALQAAGIRLCVEGRCGILAPRVEATLAWTVREGVTNVMRHSGARRCSIWLTRRGGAVAIEVADDGRGGAAPAGPAGMGLRGLAERVAAVGGRLGYGPRADGGFVVTVSVPAGDVGQRQAIGA